MNRKIIFLGIVLAIMMTASFTVLSERTSIATKAKIRYEYYTTGGDCISTLSNATWVGQTFTVGTTGPNVSFSVTSIRLPLCKIVWPGYSVGRVIVSIRDALTPSGPELIRGSFDGDVLNQNILMWHNISVVSSSPCLLQPGTTYLIALRAPFAGGNFMAFVGWDCDGSAGEYTGGMNQFSQDGGQTWTDGYNPDGDQLFEIWGTNGQMMNQMESESETGY